MEVSVIRTKSGQLTSLLRKDILAGKYPVGSRFHSENELSEQYDISHVTVREALNTLVNEGFIIRSQGKGTFVTEPKPTLSAKEVIGLVMPTSGHLYEIFSGQLIRVLAQNNLFSLVIDLSQDHGVGYRQTQALIKKQPPFLLIDGTFILLMFPLLKHYQGHIIFMHSYEETEEIPNASYVLSDLPAGGAMITEYLLTMGYRRIVHYTFMSH